MYAIALVLTLAAADSPSAKTYFRPEMFKTLVDPDCSHCRDEARRAAGALRDDDRVQAWIRGDYEGGAIPYRWFLVPYRVISDTYGVFVYDADADFIRAWPASVDFRFHGWRNGVMVMSHIDGTLFDCLTGEAFDGPRKGERLKPLPTIETNWGPWLKDHPGTVAYEMAAKFTPQSAPAVVSPESKRTRPEPDSRLDPEERVFGLTIGEASRAWPLKRFGEGPEATSIRVGDVDAVLLWDGATKTAVAFAPMTEGKAPEKATLSVDRRDPSAPWVDAETGSRWSNVGRAISGPRKGQSLQWLPGVMVKWYAWAAEYPRTELASKPR